MNAADVRALIDLVRGQGEVPALDERAIAAAYVAWMEHGSDGDSRTSLVLTRRQRMRMNAAQRRLGRN
jgi:hypothetical protein